MSKRIKRTMEPWVVIALVVWSLSFVAMGIWLKFQEIDATPLRFFLNHWQWYAWNGLAGTVLYALCHWTK